MEGPEHLISSALEKKIPLHAEVRSVRGINMYLQNGTPLLICAAASLTYVMHRDDMDYWLISTGLK